MVRTEQRKETGDHSSRLDRDAGSRSLSEAVVA